MKSDITNESLISPMIGKSRLMEALISYPPVTLSGSSEVMSPIPLRTEKIINVNMIKANIATVKPVLNFDAIG